MIPLKETFLLIIPIAEYCDKTNLPGADGAMSTFFIGSQPNLRVLVNCKQGDVLAFNNTTPANIFLCQNNQWQYVPDCVESLPKTSADCPAGYNIIKANPYVAAVCGKSIDLTGRISLDSDYNW